MTRVEIHLTEPSTTDGALLLVPKPYGHWGQVFKGIHSNGLEFLAEISAKNSNQTAIILKAAKKNTPIITYEFDEGDVKPPNSIWSVQDNQFTTPDDPLADLAQDLTCGAKSEAEKLRLMVEHAAGIFEYGHPEQRFYDGFEKVPAVCGTTRGSCVDINTFLLAAARSLGIRGQYIAGYWFHPDKYETLDMHCWLAFRPDGKLIFWDLAHHLKWGVKKLQPGLNPAGGRRVAMSCGRGLKFETPHGDIEISHFSEPIWILPGAEVKKPRLIAKIFDEATV